MGQKSSKRTELKPQAVDDQSEWKDELKVVMLGAYGVGKATILRQLQWWNEFPADAPVLWRPTLRRSTRWAMAQLCGASIELTGSIPGGRVLPENEKIRDEFLDFRTDFCVETPAFAKIVPMMQRLWQDPGIQKTWESRHLFHSLVATPYYMNRMHYWIEGLPTKEDCLYLIQRMLGISEAELEYKGVKLSFKTSCGQRNVRQRWKQMLPGADVIIFVVSAAEYNNNLFEDESVNRMQESLNLWQELAESKNIEIKHWFLLFNQMDLFHENIIKHPLTVCFPEYKSENEEINITQALTVLDSILPIVLVQLIKSYAISPAESALKYIKDQYLSRAKSRQVHIHETVAIDHKTLEPVLNELMSLVI